MIDWIKRRVCPLSTPLIRTLHNEKNNEKRVHCTQMHVPYRECIFRIQSWLQSVWPHYTYCQINQHSAFGLHNTYRNSRSYRVAPPKKRVSWSLLKPIQYKIKMPCEFVANLRTFFYSHTNNTYKTRKKVIKHFQEFSQIKIWHIYNK